MNQILHPKMLMDIAYEEAKREFQNNSFSFNELWRLTWNKATAFKKESADKWIGVFYTDLIQDKRFLLAGPIDWVLREYITVSEAEKLASTMFLYEKDDLYEEGYENYKPEEENDQEAPLTWDSDDQESVVHNLDDSDEDLGDL